MLKLVYSYICTYIIFCFKNQNRSHIWYRYIHTLHTHFPKYLSKYTWHLIAILNLFKLIMTTPGNTNIKFSRFSKIRVMSTQSQEEIRITANTHWLAWKSTWNNSTFMYFYFFILKWLQCMQIYKEPQRNPLCPSPSHPQGSHPIQRWWKHQN